MLAAVLFVAACVSSFNQALSEKRYELKLDFILDGQALKKFDVNHDGAFSLPEFQNALEAELLAAAARNPNTRGRLRRGNLTGFRKGLAEPFATLDEDRNGRVTLVEMHRAIVAKANR